jgi:hypothetical protein
MSFSIGPQPFVVESQGRSLTYDEPSGAGGGGGGAAATAAVWLLVAELDPAPFVAVTVTRSVLPTSAAPRPYCAPEAPLTAEQFAPALSQRFHAYA